MIWQHFRHYCKQTLTIPTQIPLFLHHMMCLHRLYKSLGDYDTLRGIYSSQVGVKTITKEALSAEERADYVEALRLYKEAVGCEGWEDGQPIQVEEDLWDDSMLQVTLPRLR